MESISLGLLGRGIAHSQSARLYREALAPINVDYTLYDCDTSKSIPGLHEIFSKISGLSITAPYKDHFLNEVIIEDSVVKELGAINCIGRFGDQYKATNTDLSAMRRLLPGIAKQRKVLILGDGAMARVVKQVCLEQSILFEQRSRRLDAEAFGTINLHQIADGNVLVVNCCGRSYIFEKTLPPNALFWDMNYSHVDHMRLFKDSPLYIDGLNLLEGQAIDALRFWNLLKN